MTHLLRRCAARSTIISHLGAHQGDRSFLLVRERPGKTSVGECLALQGAFDQSAHERLRLTLLSLPQSSLPLVLDLSGISALDECFLARLLKVQRELAPHRSVSFQIADDGPVLPLIRRNGLEERFGLDPIKRQALKRVAAPAFAAPRISDEKSSNRDYVTT